jgi:ABC-type lipoprotein export system ATPase subunit
MMSDTIQKISKVEIKSLWGRFDLTWDLNPDVNILSGINGSGKSTILECIIGVVTTGNIPQKHFGLVDRVWLRLNTKSIGYLMIKSKMSLSTHKTPLLLPHLRIDIVSTFDNPIPEAGRRPDENVKTELDRAIFILQKKYLDYQLNIGKKAFEIVSKNGNGSDTQEDVLMIKKTQERFLEIIDNLFKETGKRINRNKNELTFTTDKDELTPYQLSSGEKQMLVILLTALVQNNEPSIIFMDEPEISLHFDWQKKLIQFIRELNPNAQIILATHSPAVIMEGWLDKVFEVRDLITLDRQAITK